MEPAPLPEVPPGRTATVGSAPDCDVVVAGPGVAARHARLGREGPGLTVRDLGSESGTFVNGVEVRGRAALSPGDVVRFGGAAFVVRGPRAAGRGLAVAVEDATLSARPLFGPAKRILCGVGFRLAAGQFLGVLGPSGSGKSTLVRALAGLAALDSGAVSLGGVPATAAGLRSDPRVAYLPQDVVVHEALTPLAALGYAARLKGLGGPAGRASAVRASLERVGLWEHRATPIRRLSGGQRKRAALAAELLGDPRLLVLDEATSGLDPATEADMMRLFRALADEGRTVVCVTHFTGRLGLCDRLLYLAGGRLLYDGGPDGLAPFFGAASPEDVYAAQAGRPPEVWEAEFRAARRAGPPEVPPGREGDADDGPPDRAEAPRPASQALVLAERYARVQAADWPNLLLVLAQAPAIGLMVGLTFGVIRSPFAELHAAETRQVLFLLVLAVLWCSGAASAREVVKELPVLRHESRFGVSPAAYLLSKYLVLGAVALAQAAMLLAVVRALTGLAGPAWPQMAVLAASSLSGVALGLLVSAASGTSERAMTVLPVLLIAQAVFSGGLARMTGPAGAIAAAAVPAHAALDGLKSPLPTDLLNATYPGAPGHYQPPILGRGTPPAAAVALQSLHAACFLAAALVLAARSAGVSPLGGLVTGAARAAGAAGSPPQPP